MNIELGRSVRIDATVIPSNILAPSDSGLLFDCIRVINNCLKSIRKKIRKPLYCCVSTKEAKSVKLKILNAKIKQERVEKYGKFLSLARIANRELNFILKNSENIKCNKIMRHLKKLENVKQLLPMIMDQTRRRVIKSESVPSDEKIVSIFESHSNIIVKGKRDVEYGHKIFVTAGKTGLVTEFLLAQGNPSDATFFIDLVERQKFLSGRVPRQTAADGEFASAR